MCYSGHHLMVSCHFYCWVAGSFKNYSHVLRYRLTILAGGERPDRVHIASVHEAVSIRKYSPQKTCHHPSHLLKYLNFILNYL